jgi:hypothetical protein
MQNKRYVSRVYVLGLIMLIFLWNCGGGGGGGEGGGSSAPSPWQGIKQLGVTGLHTIASCVTTDSSGNVYVTGYTTGGLDGNTPTGTTDLFLTKYNSSGNKIFTKQLGVTGADTAAYGVATDSSGNVYVTGYTTGGLNGNTLTGTTDLFLTKYDSSGNITFTKQLGVTGFSTVANSVAVDSSGNIYVTGGTRGGLDGNTLSGTTDFFLTKYSSSGNITFTKQLGVALANTVANGIAIDSNGNVYVAGFTYGGLDMNVLTGTVDLFLTKYDSSGNKIFTRQLGVAVANTEAYGVAVDLSGNVYISGSTSGGLDGNTLTGTTDFFLTKYDSSGSKTFTKELGAIGTDTVAYGIAVDSSGNIYVSGSTSGGLDGNTLTMSTWLAIRAEALIATPLQGQKTFLSPSMIHRLIYNELQKNRSYLYKWSRS